MWIGTLSLSSSLYFFWLNYSLIFDNSSPIENPMDCIIFILFLINQISKNNLPLKATLSPISDLGYQIPDHNLSTIFLGEKSSRADSKSFFYFLAKYASQKPLNFFQKTLLLIQERCKYLIKWQTALMIPHRIILSNNHFFNISLVLEKWDKHFENPF